MRLAAILVAVSAACYAPTPPAGAPCDLSLNNCPAGQKCEMSPTGPFCSTGFQVVDARINGDGKIIDSAPGCLGTGFVTNVCLMPPPTLDVTVQGDRTINTAMVGSGHCDSIRAQPGGPSLCMVAGKTITIETGAHLFAQGPNPLLLVATEQIMIVGSVDVASRLSQSNIGAGADTSCASPAGNNATAVDGAGGGGAGGSFATKGANGGTGRTPNNPTPGGVASATQTPTAVRGGCGGGKGGDADGGGGTGVGGAGGGAVYLLAGTSITISGVVNASGSGGGAGNAGTFASGGAGGGGSGGMIVFDSPMITSTGELYANGGSGGGGGGDMPTRPGQPGNTPTAAAVAAAGGAGGQNGGGRGGNGSVMLTAPTNGANGTNPYCSGGGGGGGGGVIKVYGGPAPSSLGGMVSPPAT